MMSKNYADALKKKPPPAPQAREPVPKSQEESRSKRPKPTPSTTTSSQQSRPAPARTFAWGRPDGAESAKKPPTILQRPKQGERAPVIKPPPKKSKKPRPTQMSLGDVIPKHVVKTQGKQKETKQENSVQSVKESSQEEFPSLSAAGTTLASKPKPSLPAHAGWGKKAPPPKKEKPAKKVTSKQQTSKPAASSKKPEATRPSLLDFGAKPRTDESREEHDLIRLLKGDGKAPANQVSKKSGRQRIAPRKKKFTTLKKKVLQERLEAWRKLHPEDSATNATTTTSSMITETETPASNSSTCTVCLKNFAEADEVEDDDEYQEIVDNVKEMAVKVGQIRDAFVHRRESGPCPAFVRFETPKGAAAARACWDGLVVAGQKLEPVLLYPTLNDGDESDGWRDAVISSVSLEKGKVVESRSGISSSCIILKNVLSKDDFEDKDHLEERLSDIRSLAEKHGPVANIEAKQDESGFIIVITYNGNDSVAKEAVTKLDGILVGESVVSASLSPTETSSDEHVVELKNALTEGDLEDEDCLQESLKDIETLAKSLGPLSDTGGIKVDGGTVVITYRGGISVAKNAAAKLDGTVLGGNILQAAVSSQSEVENAATGWILLQNILTEDDIADEDCMEEGIEDVRELASQYGKVLNINFDPNDLTRVVRIKYEGGNEVASFAASKFNNMVLGGQTIAATTMAQASNTPNDTQTSTSAESALGPDKSRKRPADTAPKPLYSGDKLIPERFAEAKRVPKVVTSTGPRDYASISKNEEVVPLLIEMLGELMRLQRRAIEDKNAKARRRLVMGLREVARGIRAHKVKMVVMANNVDQYGAIDDKLQEILDLARQEDVPVIFELNKRKLGKAVGKSIKVSVVGIQNADGAHQQFKKLANLASKI